MGLLSFVVGGFGGSRFDPGGGWMMTRAAECRVVIGVERRETSF